MAVSHFHASEKVSSVRLIFALPIDSDANLPERRVQPSCSPRASSQLPQFRLWKRTYESMPTYTAPCRHQLHCSSTSNPHAHITLPKPMQTFFLARITRRNSLHNGVIYSAAIYVHRHQLHNRLIINSAHHETHTSSSDHTARTLSPRNRRI